MLLADRCRQIADSDVSERVIVVLIILCALFMGLETYPEFTERYEDLLWIVLYVSQVIFAIEIAVRMGAHLPRIRSFFRSFWNVFDFVIVAASFLPEIGAFALAARLLRVFRVLRVISVSDEIREFLHEMHLSAATLCFGAIVWGVFAYVLAISGYHLFGELDPARWSTLGRSAATVCYLSLLQDVPDIAEPLRPAAVYAAVYFGLFYLTLLGLAVNVTAKITSQYLSHRKEPR